MYLDIYNNITVSKKLIKIAGINTALYWAELCDILVKVFNKKTYDEKGFFTLDRKYVTEQISLNETDQISCDNVLKNLGVLESDPNDLSRIRIDVSKMLGYITDSDLKAIKSLTKQAKQTREEKSAAKKAGMKSTMLTAVSTVNADLLEAYKRWIDCMVESRRITKAQVQVFQQTVESYTDNVESQIKIIDIATTKAYMDAAWAINVFNRDYKRQGQLVNTTKQLERKDVLTDVQF